MSRAANKCRSGGVKNVKERANSRREIEKAEPSKNKEQQNHVDQVTGLQYY